MPETISIDLTSAGIWINETGTDTPSVVLGYNYSAGENSYKFGQERSGATYVDIHQWLRFQFPFDSTEIEISNAYIYCQAFGFHGVYGKLYHQIWGHADDDSADPASAADANAWIRTSNNLPGPDEFYSEFGGTVGLVDVYRANLKDIINEIITRGGWVKNNHLAFILRSAATNRTFTNVSHQESDPFKVPKLILEYEIKTPVPSGADAHVDSVLTITQFVDYDIEVIHPVEHTLTIEQDIAWSIVHNKSVESVLTIASLPHLVQTYHRSLEHLLIVTGQASASVARPKSVEHTLNITQDIIRNGPRDKQIVHELDIEQDIEWSYAWARTVEHTLDIDQDIRQTHKNRRVIHMLRITQDIAYELTSSTHGVRHTLNIEQDISYNVNRTRAVESQLNIRQSVLGYTGNQPGCSRLDRAYRPYADGSINFPPEPTLVRGDITLSYGELELVLPAPLFGDHEELQITRIQRKTRGGVLKTYTDDDWARVRTFRFKFEGLDTAKTLEVFTFFGNTLGLNVHLIDHEGREWDGYIVNPQGEAAQFFRQCGNTTEFDFEGVLSEE